MRKLLTAGDIGPGENDLLHNARSIKIGGVARRYPCLARSGRAKHEDLRVAAQIPQIFRLLLVHRENGRWPSFRLIFFLLPYGDDDG